MSEVSSVDLPTDGKPTRPTRASPVAFTSKPSPAPCAPVFGPSKSSSRLYLASFALRPQMCAIVCLLICVRAISSSMSLIFATRDDMPPYYHGGAEAREAGAARALPRTSRERGVLVPGRCSRSSEKT